MGTGDTSSDDGEESDENYQISPPRGTKRSGWLMRGISSSGGQRVSSGGAQPDDDEEEEEE